MGSRAKVLTCFVFSFVLNCDVFVVVVFVVVVFVVVFLLLFLCFIFSHHFSNQRGPSSARNRNSVSLAGR